MLAHQQAMSNEQDLRRHPSNFPGSHHPVFFKMLEPAVLASGNPDAFAFNVIVPVVDFSLKNRIPAVIHRTNPGREL